MVLSARCEGGSMYEKLKDPGQTADKRRNYLTVQLAGGRVEEIVQRSSLGVHAFWRACVMDPVKVSAYRLNTYI